VKQRSGHIVAVSVSTKVYAAVVSARVLRMASTCSSATKIVEADEQASSNAMSPTLPPAPNTSPGRSAAAVTMVFVWYFVLRARLTGIGLLEAGFLLWPPMA
jgi:hypothetical protein